MKIACCQTDIVWEDRAANHAVVSRMLDSAGLPPGSLVALPEMFHAGFSMNVERIAESEERETERFLSEHARRRELYILGGVVNRDPGGRGRNEAVVFGPDGAEMARYCKM